VGVRNFPAIVVVCREVIRYNRRLTQTVGSEAAGVGPNAPSNRRIGRLRMPNPLKLEEADLSLAEYISISGKQAPFISASPHMV